MKLARYTVDGRPSWGAVVDDGLVDLSSRMPGLGSLRALLGAGSRGLRQASDVIASSRADHALADVRWLPTVEEPSRSFCIGVNYANRNAEYKDGSDLPKYPSIFMRVPESFVGHEAALVEPLESRQLDYEGEIGLIIGRPARRVSSADALGHIAGLTCVNEGTIRDWVHHAKFNVTQGKNFEASGSVGPWMVTADEFSNYDKLRLQTRVNGELRQDDTTANLMFDFAYLISYLSTFVELKPGDLIVTGTPTGAGIRFDPPRFLKPGDTVEVEVEGVGVLSNPVKSESGASNER